MGLNEETRTALIAAMGKTPKGLRGAQDGGGHFYFLADSKGVEGALVVLSKDKDTDGKKTFRIGRGLLKDFRSGGVKPLYSQGEVAAGSPMVFNIQKGNAKPALISRAFKKCEMIHSGVGSALVGVLKGAKIAMAGGGSAPAPDSTEDASVSDEEIAWASTPEMKELIADLELSPEDLHDLYAAQKAFEAYAEDLPLSEDEDTALQLQQAETEALLDALAAGDEELERLKASAPTGEKTLALEDELNQARIALAQKSAVGPSPFNGELLSDVDRQALTASIRAGLELLLARIVTLRSEIAKEHTMPSDQDDQSQREARHRELTSEMSAVTAQFKAIRLPV
jgi:hypothetical protein